jgi:hypothetical protein
MNKNSWIFHPQFIFQLHNQRLMELKVYTRLAGSIRPWKATSPLFATALRAGINQIIDNLGAAGALIV